MIKKLIALTAVLCIAVNFYVSAAIAQDSEPYRSARMMEELGRGLVAVQTGDGVFLSWRLLGTENYNTKFNIYRNGMKIAYEFDATNYTDAQGTKDDSYTVRAVYSGTEQNDSNTVKPMENQYFDIPIDRPEAADLNINGEETVREYAATDASCGDLDGDGEYELILRWDCNPQDNGEGFEPTGIVYFDAYKIKFNGDEQFSEKMWRVSLGKNIRSGEHYNQFAVYDLDGDGKAEFCCKTAPGTLDGKGKYVSEASGDVNVKDTDNNLDYSNSDSRVLQGPEFFTVFNGETGEAVDTIEYPALRGDDEDNTLNSPAGRAWGDKYGNRCDRFLMTVAYLDGMKPNVVTWRGYYGGKDVGPGRTAVNALAFDGKQMSLTASFDTYSGAKHGYQEGNEKYIGQGNHNIVPGDVDGDGKDEILAGSLALDNDLTPLWCSGKGHGDASHLADYDPTHDGLEFLTAHEESPFGLTVFDAATGTELGHWDGGKDTGRGIMANVGAVGYYQITGASGVGQYVCNGGSDFSNFSVRSGMGMNFRIFWDGDLYDELLDGINISKYQGGRTPFVNIFTASGCKAVNGTKNVPALQADLFGDWREEIVYPTSDYTNLRVYTTIIPTEHKLYTLMHDYNYRMQVSTEMSAYNQPPHIGYYVSENNDEYDARQDAAYVQTPDTRARTENIPEKYNVLVEKISMKKSMILNIGDVENLEPIITPDYALNKNLTWSVSSDAVIRVDSDGKVTAVGEGTATITAKASDGSNVIAVCRVKVMGSPRIDTFSQSDGSMRATITNSDAAKGMKVIFAVNNSAVEICDAAPTVTSQGLTYQTGDEISVYMWDLKNMRPICIGKNKTVE